MRSYSGVRGRLLSWGIMGANVCIIAFAGFYSSLLCCTAARFVASECYVLTEIFALPTLSSAVWYSRQFQAFKSIR